MIDPQTNATAPELAPALLARFRSLPDAEAARSALEAAGIETYLADENLVALNWLYSNAVGGLRLFVRTADLAAARDVLSGEREVAEPMVELTEGGPSPAWLSCPECGAIEVGPIPKFVIFGSIVLLSIVVAAATGFHEFALLLTIIVALILMISPSHKCRQCGHIWSPEPIEPDREAPVPDEIETPDVACPRCGSAETVRMRRRREKGVTLTLSFLGIFLWLPFLLAWPFLKKWQCTTCGNQF